MSYAFMVDIEVYDVYGEGEWAQAKYLVHGYDDVYWTNDLNMAVRCLKHEIKAAEKELFEG